MRCDRKRRPFHFARSCGQISRRAITAAVATRAIEANGPLRYEAVRLAPVPGGFVQQHVVRGRALVLPAVVVCQVRDGRITRLDEYFDSAQLAPR